MTLNQKNAKLLYELTPQLIKFYRPSNNLISLPALGGTCAISHA